MQWGYPVPELSSMHATIARRTTQNCNGPATSAGARVRTLCTQLRHAQWRGAALGNQRIVLREEEAKRGDVVPLSWTLAIEEERIQVKPKHLGLLFNAESLVANHANLPTTEAPGAHT